MNVGIYIGGFLCETSLTFTLPHFIIRPCYRYYERGEHFG